MAKPLAKEQFSNLTVVWRPQEGPQSWLITCPVFEVLFGGARGGGKSDGVLGEWATHADQYGENAIGLCVRRERTQLLELIERSKVLYFPLGAKFSEIDKMWRFPNGARLRFAYLESDNDAQAYQGHSYSRVYVEEMGTFPNPEPIFKLMATLRSGAAVPCRFIATANPGGPGHLWIKQRYIDPAPLGMKVLPTEFENPFTGEKLYKERVFIPSKVSDNKYTNTSEYIGNLYLAGNDDLVKAWLMGDWNVMLGAFFQEWNTRLHVVKKFDVPRHWTRFMSMDWGSAKPFSVGWWAIVPDEFDTELDVGPNQWRFMQEPSQFKDYKLILPKNAIIRYREWYGSLANKMTKEDEGRAKNFNRGLKLTAEDVAEGIKERERFEPSGYNSRANISYRVIDPSAFKEDGGPSIAERMAKSPYYLNFMRADNARVAKAGAMGGWDQVRSRLKGEDGRPMIYFMDNCVDSIRTLPALQHDQLKLEDVDTTMEDHAPDDIRYACMSRPYTREPEKDVIKRLFKAKTDHGLFLHDDLSTLSAPSLSLNNARIH